MLYFYELKDGKKKMRQVESNDALTDVNHQGYMKKELNRLGLNPCSSILALVK